MTTAVSSTATFTAACGVDAVKIYGEGDTEVRALDGLRAAGARGTDRAARHRQHPHPGHP